MTTYNRADWQARPARPGPGLLYARDVVGLTFHWPAMQRPVRGFAAVAAALRAWQDYHMDRKGWSDIAYQVAVDQDGNRWELRGLDTQSAANGDKDVNNTLGAVLLILAPGEQPSRKMIREVRRVVRDHRDLFHRSRQLLGHNEVRPEATACPGPIVQAHLAAGTFEPVSLADLRLRRRLKRAQWAAGKAGRERLRLRLKKIRRRLPRP